MQKKVMALAVAGALAAPAAAFAQAVQIYGRANVGLDSYQATGATVSTNDQKSRNRVFDQGSRLGVRGSEDLGSGLKAIFQIESGVNIDTGTNAAQSGGTNTSTGFLASRDSYVGLDGGFGRVQMGRLAVWYTNGAVEQMTANYVNIGTPESSGNLSKVGGPVFRQSNIIQYTTPTFGGFNGGVYYSPDAQEAAPANVSANGKITGITGTYSGVVNVKADYAQNEPQHLVTGDTISKKTGLKVGVGWPYAPGAQVSFILLNLKQDNVGAALDSVKQAGYVLNWEQVFGNIQALAQYGKSNKPTGCTGTACDNFESTSYMIGARYLMSKRTAAYVTYNSTTNKDASALDYTSAGYHGQAIGAGADPRVWAIGLMHNF